MENKFTEQLLEQLTGPEDKPRVRFCSILHMIQPKNVCAAHRLSIVNVNKQQTSTGADQRRQVGVMGTQETPGDAFTGCRTRWVKRSRLGFMNEPGSAWMVVPDPNSRVSELV